VVNAFRLLRSLLFRKRSGAFLASLLVFGSAVPTLAIDVVGVQAASTAVEGATLTMREYIVPVDGLLVVRVGARGSTSQTVRFAGEQMIHAASMEVTYFTTLSVEMFYLPVVAGESGAIDVVWGHSGTDQRGLVAATLEDATDLEFARVFTDGLVQQDGRTGPNLAQVDVASTRESVLLSAFTVLGSGIPEIVGARHALDGYPTVPESAFHDMKLQAGHMIATGAGNQRLGYRNTNPRGYMDYAMIVTSFTRVPEPSVGMSVLIGSVAIAAVGRGRRRT